MNHTSKLPLTLLPKVPGLRLEDTFIDADTVSLTLASTSLPVACPLCGHATARLHSHYRRTVADLPWSGRRVRMLLSVRKSSDAQGLDARAGSSPNACLLWWSRMLARRLAYTRSSSWWASC